MDNRYVIGADFGTDSVRILIVDSDNGREITSAVCEYARWKEGRYCDPAANQFRQHPMDYIEAFETAVKTALSQAPESTASAVKAIGIDTTGSTPCAVDKKGVPLALYERFRNNPNAMFILWKDHTAVAEAEEINAACSSSTGNNYIKYVGGIYSSEWFWAKILHVLREDNQVKDAAYSWMEHCDWMPALLTGNSDAAAIKRSRCAAGHKALWHTAWKGLPPETFLSSLDNRLSGLRERLYSETFTADVSAGNLSREWSERLGLGTDVQVAVGAFDAHLGAVGAQIEPYHLCKVMGTSTCDILVAPMKDVENRLVHGICGQVDGSVLPGMLGMEAGQSSFGDVYAWFRDILMFPFPRQEIHGSNGIGFGELEDKIIPALSKAAEVLPVDPSGPIAVDWLNGRRSPDANQRLKMGITGLNLSTDASRIFKTLVEATAFGAKAIVDRFISEGIPIHGIIGTGGVAKKNPFIMQTISDVLNMPMRITRSEQTVALGSAMAGATAAGIFTSLQDAQERMGQGFEQTYIPHAGNVKLYDRLYEKYKELGAFIEKTAAGE
ncbi:ribulokinase [bacterium]|nr:ribulokinase [bacterium]